MPPPAIVDLSEVDLTRVQVTREEIYSILPHRYEFMQVDGIICYNVEKHFVVAYRDVRPDEWWCRAHIPGRPIFPGVLMIETVAHLAAFYFHKILNQPGFLGFSAIDEVKFRGAVTPPARIIITGRAVDIKSRRLVCATQAFVDGAMVFQGKITGMPI